MTLEEVLKHPGLKALLDRAAREERERQLNPFNGWGAAKPWQQAYRPTSSQFTDGGVSPDWTGPRETNR